MLVLLLNISHLALNLFYVENQVLELILFFQRHKLLSVVLHISRAATTTDCMLLLLLLVSEKDEPAFCS